MTDDLSLSYIAIGSNLKDPAYQVKKAITAINNQPYIKLLVCSNLYNTKPLEFKEQPDYVNAVVKVSTHLSAFNLLKFLKKIELNHGRVRNEHWGSRIIDLDILLYNNIILTTDILTIPHPQLKFRDFVLQPLLEIAPELVLPTGESLKKIAHKNNIQHIINKSMFINDLYIN